MDPLSITASAVALIQVAGTVTTTLCRFVRTLKTVDLRVTCLCKELTDLTGFLQAIGNAVKGCQRQDLGLDGDGLWPQSELALANCQTTLNELALLVNKISDSSRPKRFARRVRTAVDLNIYGDDLAMYRDRVHQSNSALQTMLHAITVALSIKNNASQGVILRELQRLEASIKEALHTSSRPVGGFHNTGNGSPGAHVAGNLRRLAEAAKQFHATTSSTAGTVRSDGSDAPLPSYTGANISLFGDFPVSRRQRVEEFLGRHSVELPEPLSRQSTPSIQPFRVANIASVTAPEPEVPSHASTIDEEDENDEDPERSILGGLTELAAVYFKDRNYDRAIQFLQEAMTRDISPGESSHEYHQLQLQLALCYLFEGKWRLASPLVMKAVESKVCLELAECNLLHALALGYLSDCSFDEALAACRQALKGKKRLLKRGDIEPNEYWETFGLHAAIVDATSNSIRAEAYRLQLPRNFTYVHPASEVDFVLFCPGLLQSIFGVDGVAHRIDSLNGNVVELAGGTIGDQTQQFSIVPEVVAVDAQSPNDGDDETSPTSIPRKSSLRRQLSRFLSVQRRRPVDTGNGLTESDSPVSNHSPSALSPTKLRWPRGDVSLQAKKLKALWTRKPYKETSSQLDEFDWSTDAERFKLLRMERTPTPTTFRPSPPFNWRGEAFHPHLHTRGDDQRGYHAVAGRVSPVPVPNVGLEASQGRRSVTGAGDVDGRIPESPLFPAELADTGVPTQSLVRNGSKTCLGSDRQHCSPFESSETSMFPDKPAARRCSDENEQNWPLRNGSSPPPINNRTELWRQENSSASRTNSAMPIALGQPRKLPYPTTSSPTLALPSISAELAQLITQLSTTMASLSGSQNTRELRAKESLLRALVPRLKALGSDQTLFSDVERVILSLESKTRSTEGRGADSGYESLANTGSNDNTPAIQRRRQPTTLLQSTSVRLEEDWEAT